VRREWLLKTALLAGSLLISLILGEAAVRLVFPAGDLLMPVLTRNDVLGVRLRPGTWGFDEWGFRNPSVPARTITVSGSVGAGKSSGGNSAYSAERRLRSRRRPDQRPRSKGASTGPRRERRRAGDGAARRWRNAM